MSASTRRVAHRVLVRVFDEGAYADRAFAAEAAQLEPRDRAFAQRIAYGAIQRVRTLDHAIETIGGRRVAELDVPVRAALRLGAYELGFLDAVPARASVNEAVELVRASGAGRATGLVNAILRRVAERIRPLLDELPVETPQQAALAYSYPDWIAETWWREWGPEEARALMRAQNEPAETAYRVIGTGEVRVVDRIDPDAVVQGRAWPQSRGSHVAGAAVGARIGERVLDVCAAPGGKTTQLAETASEVVAVEIHPGRARELEASVRHLGLRNVTVVNADARELPAELQGFDRVLVDAPCSGLGVLASRPDLRWRAKPLPELQLELLRMGAERVDRKSVV
jgi:16S rRNA (cytosine967-C5)-methyltransferase